MTSKAAIASAIGTSGTSAAAPPHQDQHHLLGGVGDGGERVGGEHGKGQELRQELVLQRVARELLPSRIRLRDAFATSIRPSSSTGFGPSCRSASISILSRSRSARRASREASVHSRYACHERMAGATRKPVNPPRTSPTTNPESARAPAATNDVQNPCPERPSVGIALR